MLASLANHRAGGVCLYVNERWCKTIIIREKVCTKHIELLSVSLRPHYLPREFPQIFVTVVYIHLRANEEEASESILKVTQKLQSLSPDAPVFVLGDFNHCSLKRTHKNFYQYVTCPTRHNKILDLCYGSVKGAFKSLPLPPLGGADHNCVQLMTAYRSALRRGKIITKQIHNWTDDSKLSLQDCFEKTDWGMFKESCSDIDELTDVVSSYVTFCEDCVIPKKSVKIFPNSKPWVSKTLKNLLNKKRKAF